MALVRVFWTTIFLTTSLHAAPEIRGDYTAGQAKSAVCSACHGSHGESINALWPNIAGQHPTYLAKQLRDFKEGSPRNSPTMTPLVSELSEQDRQDLAVFYSRQAIVAGVAKRHLLKRGEQLYRGGDFRKHITACIACHGPQGLGNAQAGFPMLSGQHQAYTVSQLQAFKEKKRLNDLNSIMHDISMRMDPSDMEAVANYIAGLH